MRILNGVLYLGVVVALVLMYVNEKGIWENLVGKVIREYRVLLGIAVVANSISFALTLCEPVTNRLIERQGYDGEEIPVNLQLETDGQTEEYALSVRPKQYGTKEAKQLMQEAFRELETSLKGENASYNEITSDLIVGVDYQKYPFDMDVQPEDYSLIDETGRVHNSEEELADAGFTDKEIQQGISTAVKIIFTYGDLTMDKTYPMTIVKQRQESFEQQFATAKRKLSMLEQSKAEEDTFLLPEDVDGVRIRRLEKQGAKPEQILLLGGLLMIVYVFWNREQSRQQKRQRQQQLLRSYPWFVNEMVLMLGAGMQVKHIFAQILAEYKKMGATDDREPLIRELMVADQAFHVGMAEEQIYYQLGRRLELPSYIKLMTLLEQNVVKGSKGLRDIFEQEEQTALEERKNLAKKLGEEAGTKLLGPMILLLVIVMLIVMVPAFLSF